MILITTTPTEYLNHPSSTPDFQFIWQQVDTGAVRIGGRLGNIDPKSLQQELEEYFDGFKELSYGTEHKDAWAQHTLEWSEGMPSSKRRRNLLDEPIVMERVYRADLLQRMVHLMKGMKIEDKELYSTIDVAASFPIGFALACDGQFALAKTYLAKCIAAIDDGTTGVAAYSSDAGEAGVALYENGEQQFYEKYGMPTRAAINRIYEIMKEKGRCNPSVALQGSLQGSIAKALSQEDYETAAILRDQVQAIDDRLRDLSPQERYLAREIGIRVSPSPKFNISPDCIIVNNSVTIHLQDQRPMLQSRDHLSNIIANVLQSNDYAMRFPRFFYDLFT